MERTFVALYVGMGMVVIHVTALNQRKRMPYIAECERPYYRDILKQIGSINTKGRLEYCIAYLLLKYMQNKEWRYSNLHDATYAAIHAGEEFKRRYLDKREDDAIETHGDIILDGDEDE